MLCDFILYPFRLLIILIIILIDSSIAFFGSLLVPKFYRQFQHYRSWAKRLLFFAGVRIETIGLKNLEKGKSFVFVSNHSSYFDIPAIFVAIPQQIRIMYKKELEKIPFFGWYLRVSDFIPVEREESASARRSLTKAVQLIKENISVLIFPEGTRSFDGELQDFKRGAFLLALKANKEIVPLTIRGSYEILPRGKLVFLPGKIKVIVGRPIDVRLFSQSNNLDKLIKIVWEEINRNLKGDF